MLKFLHLIVWFAMWVGISDVLVNLVIDMRGTAIHAHRNHQISFEKFSRMLTSTENKVGPTRQELQTHSNPKAGHLNQ